ncbi:hypothetical protein N8T08_010463 [Aspergillus melleus]|uniref:Uncharacterized protein n=1 Tax=Aspergillus melleus TaxID=138277 RepID=A0ACC3ARH3_9EURO|nr:hypothetical protein N8T08_010463 [Aspergillus melleus]
MGSFKALGAPYAVYKILSDEANAKTGPNISAAAALLIFMAMSATAGAVVIRIDGEYKASVARAKEDARMNGWYFVSSTSCSDFDNDVLQHVMNAYMVVLEEALSIIPAVDRITHVFVCGGVGNPDAPSFKGFIVVCDRCNDQLDEGGSHVVGGESSAASMGIMLGSITDHSLQRKLVLDENSHVLMFGLKGATDPRIYESIVGKSPQAVFAA